MAKAAQQADQEHRVFRLLLIGFFAQIAGQLVDLQWHATHDEFEGGMEQLQAHWLIWLATLFVTVVAVLGWRQVSDEYQRRGYATFLIANLIYAVVAVIHFFQHLDRLEVDWTHISLAITKVVSVVGVLWVIAARVRRRST